MGSRSFSTTRWGRLRRFQQYWRQVTADKWALEVIEKGYALPFTSSPPLANPVETPQPQDPVKLDLLSREIQALVSKHAVEIVPNGTSLDGYYSH